ncbi:MAG: hypothetical protein ACI3X1_02565 [Eubacteriales bacterium]
MLYDNYKRKILSVGRVLKVIVKFLPLIIIVVAAVTVISATLVATKGIVSDIDLTQMSVEYGDEFNPHASAFLSDITYEYSADGINWTTDYPDKPGTYHVRAVGNASFGNKRYSNAVTFEIAKRKIEVSIPMGVDFIYGSHDVYAAVAEGDFVECGNFVFENIKEIDENTANADITPVLSTIRIFDSRGNDITESHYEISVVTLDANVVKLPLNITVQDQNEIYNGNTFSFDTYEFDNAELAVGDTLVSTYPTSIIEPGEQEITPSFQVRKTDSVNADNEPVSPIDITAFYKLNITYGTLTVEKRPLVIELSNYTAEYSDSPIEFRGYTLIENEDSLKLVEGHSIKVKEEIVYPSDVGIHNNPTVFCVVDKDGNDVTDNYSLIYLSASIEINPRPVKVTTSSESFVYDGKAHSNSEFVCDGVLEGHKVSVDIPEGQDSTASLKNVGTVENKFNIKIFDETGRDVTANYDLTYVYGILEITKCTVNIKTNSESFVYDATEHFNSQFSYSKLVQGHTASVSLPEGQEKTISITDVGTVENIFEIKVVDEKGIDVTGNYDIKYEYGKLTVTTRDIEINPVPKDKYYDGKPLDTQEITWTEEDSEKKCGLLTSADHTVSVTPFSTKKSDCGEYQWILTADDVKIYCGEIDVTDNYNVRLSDVPTTISIKKSTVYVKPKDVTATYDGQLHKAEAVEFAEISKGFIDLGFSVEYTGTDLFAGSSNAGRTDAGTQKVKISASEIGNIIVKLKGVDVTNNFNVDISADETAGTITIDKRPITVTPILKDKVYNGEKLKSTETEITSGTLVDGHTVVASFESSHADVGTYSWDLSETSLKIMAGGVDVTGNYEITYGKNATAKITERKVYIIPDISNHEKVYDADYFYADAIKEYTSREADTGLLTALGHSISLKSDDKHIRTADKNVGEDLSMNFYTDDSARCIEDILVFSGAGISADNYEVVFLGEAKEGYIEGTIKVKIVPYEITLTPNLTYSDPDTKYNGDNIKAFITSSVEDGTENAWTINGHEFTVSAVFGEYSNVGTYIWRLSADANGNQLSDVEINGVSTDNPESGVVIRLNGKDVTRNFTISYSEQPATITIVKRDITLSPILSHNGIYDGELLKSGIVCDISGNDSWSLGDNNIFSVTAAFGEYRNAGFYSYFLSNVDGTATATLSYNKKYGESIKDENKAEIHICCRGIDVTDNFNISYDEKADIEIKKRTVYLSPCSDEKYYNSSKHQVTDISFWNLVSGHKFTYSDVEFLYTDDTSGVTTNDGFAGHKEYNSSANVSILSGTFAIHNESGDDVTDNYEFNTELSNGTLFVWSRLLVISPDVSNKVYDGTCISSEKVILGWTNGDGVTCTVQFITPARSNGIDAGVYTIKCPSDINVQIVDSEGNDITEDFHIEYRSAIASITPRTVYITTGSAEKEYDGTELICHNWELDPTRNTGDNGLIAGYTKDDITVTFTGTQTNAGSSDNTAEASIDDNFIVKVIPGKLTVNPCKIKLTLANIQSVYDGNPITKGIKFRVECAIKDKISVVITQINVINVNDTFEGVSDLVYTVQWKNGEALESGNYEIIIDNNPKIHRTKAEITVTSHSFTANYEEGKSHYDRVLDVTGLLDGYTLTGEATTSIMGDPEIKVEEKNVFNIEDIVIYDAYGNDATENFSINPVYGKITIIPKQS